MGIISLELGKEFVGCRESAIRLADTGDSVDYELAEAIIADEVE